MGFLQQLFGDKPTGADWGIDAPSEIAADSLRRAHCDEKAFDAEMAASVSRLHIFAQTEIKDAAHVVMMDLDNLFALAQRHVTPFIVDNKDLSAVLNEHIKSSVIALIGYAFHEANALNTLGNRLKLTFRGYYLGTDTSQVFVRRHIAKVAAELLAETHLALRRL